MTLSFRNSCGSRRLRSSAYRPTLPLPPQGGNTALKPWGRRGGGGAKGVHWGEHLSRHGCYQSLSCTLHCMIKTQNPLFFQIWLAQSEGCGWPCSGMQHGGATHDSGRLHALLAQRPPSLPHSAAQGCCPWRTGCGSHACCAAWRPQQPCCHQAARRARRRRCQKPGRWACPVKSREAERRQGRREWLRRERQAGAGV